MSSEDTQAVQTDNNQADSEGVDVGQSTEDTTDDTTVEPTDSQDDDMDTSSPLEDADRTELLKEIAKLRKENASRRVKSKEVEEAAQKWQEHLDSQKSDMQRLQEMNTAMKEKLETFEREKTQQDIAKEVGLDPDLADLIVGSDLDEMKEKAQRLATKLKTQKPKTTAKDMKAGEGRDKQVETDSNKWFRDLLNS